MNENAEFDTSRLPSQIESSSFSVAMSINSRMQPSKRQQLKSSRCCAQTDSMLSALTFWTMTVYLQRISLCMASIQWSFGKHEESDTLQQSGKQSGKQCCIETKLADRNKGPFSVTLLQSHGIVAHAMRVCTKARDLGSSAHGNKSPCLCSCWKFIWSASKPFPCLSPHRSVKPGLSSDPFLRQQEKNQWSGPVIVVPRAREHWPQAGWVKLAKVWILAFLLWKNNNSWIFLDVFSATQPISSPEK